MLWGEAEPSWGGDRIADERTCDGGAAGRRSRRGRLGRGGLRGGVYGRYGDGDGRGRAEEGADGCERDDPVLLLGGHSDPERLHGRMRGVLAGGGEHGGPDVRDAAARKTLARAHGERLSGRVQRSSSVPVRR